MPGNRWNTFCHSASTESGRSSMKQRSFSWWGFQKQQRDKSSIPRATDDACRVGYQKGPPTCKSSRAAVSLTELPACNTHHTSIQPIQKTRGDHWPCTRGWHLGLGCPNRMDRALKGFQVLGNCVKMEAVGSPSIHLGHQHRFRVHEEKRTWPAN